MTLEEEQERLRSLAVKAVTQEVETPTDEKSSIV
jgi:hypothetical protein